MKRQYMAPEIEILEYSTEEMIATSSVTSNNGLDYGGIDEEGEKEAESRPPIDFFLFE
jgi:hypothetical protein